MYVCMYVCLSVFLSVCLSVCIYVCMYVCMYKRVHYVHHIRALKQTEPTISFLVSLHVGDVLLVCCPYSIFYRMAMYILNYSTMWLRTLSSSLAFLVLWNMDMHGSLAPSQPLGCVYVYIYTLHMSYSMAAFTEKNSFEACLSTKH